jgi:hypothetical protein
VLAALARGLLGWKRKAFRRVAGENTLDKIKGADFWLGRSLSETDAGFTSSINELRVFNSALTGGQIAAPGKAGSVTLQTPK